jgi:hypothetical protein
MKDGKVLESGSHDQLMALKGLYYSLVVTQSSGLEPMDKKKKGNLFCFYSLYFVLSL